MKSIGKHFARFLVGAILVGSAIPSARAQFTFTGSSGNLTASVTFAQSGTDLLVTLSNISGNDVLLQSDVLTAVFFTLAGDPTLTRTSAVVPAGHSVLFGTTDSGGVVGGEWAYKDGLSGAPLGADEGISSAGLGLFGPGDCFPGSNLQGPTSPNGLQYGITSAGDNPATGQSAVTGSSALIQYSVVFTLSGLPAEYTLTESSISALSFQYGTALPPTDPNVAVIVPEPSTVTLVAAGMGVVALLTWRRRSV